MQVLISKGTRLRKKEQGQLTRLEIALVLKTRYRQYHQVLAFLGIFSSLVIVLLSETLTKHYYYTNYTNFALLLH
jgi:uncharacterized membrane protein